jgi:flagellar biosynthesis chaperone FliJ
MKKFQFPLETLLKVRTRAIKIQGIELFEHAKRCLELKEEEHALREQMRLAIENREESRLQGKIKDECAYERYLLSLEEKLCALSLEKEKSQKNFVCSQQKTSKAIQERKIVEKLKEKKYSLWETKIEQQESSERERHSAISVGFKKGFTL